VVIVNGVDFEAMDTLLRESAIIRERLGPRPDDFVLGCVSRFDPVKRLEVLRLQDRIPTVVLILVGAVARKTGSAASRKPWVSRST
jgi:hypothetical protein